MPQNHTTIDTIANNKALLAQFSRYIPLVIGLAILLIITLLAPWDEIKGLLQKVPPHIFLALGGLSALYYASKAIRFWYILRLLDIHTPFWNTNILYLSGQLVSFLPAGELYRTVLLKKHYEVSISQSSPSVTFQGLVEAIVMLFFSLLGAFIIGRNQIPVVLVGLLLVALIIILQRGWMHKSYPLINKVPFITLNKTKFQRFVQGHQRLLEPKALTSMIAISLIPVLSGISILYLSGQAIGFDISYVQSMIGYSLPSIISGLTFLPGGLGVSEGSTIGMLQLFGATSAVAMTTTLLVRIFTLVAGLVFGLIAQLLLHLTTKS